MLSRDETAFTIVEMVVAMFVSLIVLALFSSMFRDVFSRTAANDSAAISGARLTEALDRIGDDLRSARADRRADIALISVRDDLKTKMIAEPEAFGDIVVAGGRQLAFWSESEADAGGARCVSWQLEQVMDGERVWALTRRSGTPGGACPAPAGGPTEVVLLLGPQAPTRHPFAYSVLTPAAGDTCSLARHAPGAPPATLNAATRLRVIAVEVDLGSIVARRAKSTTNSGRGSFDVWSRLNDDYYYAIGCAQ